MAWAAFAGFLAVLWFAAMILFGAVYRPGITRVPCIITRPCTECRGRGEVQSSRRLQLTIPPGVDDGAQIQLRGEGEAGARGGPPGDLYVVLSVGGHDR